MKKISLTNPKKNTLTIKVQPNSLNYLTVEQLKKYLAITDKYIMPESKDIIDYLIVNNTSYLTDLDKENEENVLAGFFNAGYPDKADFVELYNKLEKVVKENRVLEIPVFQTKEQFNSIINKTCHLDLIVMDFKDDKSRNNIAIKYTPLVHKICKQYYGKSNLNYEDLLSVAFDGLTYAMNTYGKKSNIKDDNIDSKNISSQSFLQWAAYIIRFTILDAIAHESRTVRIAKSQLNKERKKNGQNTKSNTVSGDLKVGINNSEDGNKTVFDFIDSQEYSDSALDKADLDKVWGEIYTRIKKEFGEQIFNIWCGFYGINGKEKLKNKELAATYNVSNSSITYYCTKVNNYLQKDKVTFKLLQEVYALMQECLNDQERNSKSIYETYHIKI